MKYKIGDMFVLDGDRGTDRAVVIIIGEYVCKYTHSAWHVVDYIYYNLYGSKTSEIHKSDVDIDIMIDRDKFTYIPA